MRLYMQMESYRKLQSSKMQGKKNSLGVKRTDEFRIALSKRNKKFGIVPPSFANKKHTNVTKNKMSIAHKDKKKGPMSHAQKRKISIALKGKIVSYETRLKLSKANRGQLSYRWKGGIYKTNNEIRRSPQYKRWQHAVYMRDGYLCQICGIKGNKLNANHIKKFSDYPDLRFDINNGITLCVNCHKNITNKEEQFEGYFKEKLKTGNFL